jgi:hypothetical protein
MTRFAENGAIKTEMLPSGVWVATARRLRDRICFVATADVEADSVAILETYLMDECKCVLFHGVIPCPIHAPGVIH